MNNLKKTDIIYQVFVRNFSKEGTFKKVEEKLDYIKSLNATMIQLLPINPIGKIDRIGKVGSPYSISDYLAINPDLGTVEDLKSLIKSAHKIGLKVIQDIVFNHTSKDSVLLKQHPDYYFRDEKGNIIIKFPEWSDIIDINHKNPELEKYLIGVLKYYVELGIDGFRFDVASLIRKEFFSESKNELLKINPNLIYIAECVDSGFINLMRRQGFDCYSNQELVDNGIDGLYHYASWGPFRSFLKSKDDKDLQQYKGALYVEGDAISKDAYIIRAIENHDYPRIASYSKVESFTRSLLAYSFFTTGPAFVFNGEECKDDIKPNLFEKDVMNLEIIDHDYFDFFMKNSSLKIREINNKLRNTTCLDSSSLSLVMQNNYEDHIEIGIFNFAEKENIVTSSDFIDGIYKDLLTEKEVKIENKTLRVDQPLILIK